MATFMNSNIAMISPGAPRFHRVDSLSEFENKADLKLAIDRIAPHAGVGQLLLR
jgi:hypothetical protein